MDDDDEDQVEAFLKYEDCEVALDSSTDKHEVILKIRSKKKPFKNQYEIVSMIEVFLSHVHQEQYITSINDTSNKPKH